ncbi:hypothetical protein [Marinicellulosiphila megalodicopiae]|uniref:hypothetical protein n=1 Tax=Marinicellulosiphila megalodicopiae TaxID=2724896 RepID=UPI003BB1BA49
MKHFLPLFFTTFVLTLPLLISSFSAQAANLINSILTGRYSYIDLAAVSYGFLMVMSIGSISQGGIGALLPSMQKAIKEQSHLALYANIIALLGYVLVSLLIFVGFYLLTFYLNVTNEYQQTIRLYLLPMIIFLIALQLLSFAVNILVITEKIKIIAMFGLCATGLDIITSSVLVHGVVIDQVIFIQQLGATGAAMGSMFGSLCVTYLAYAYLYKTKAIQFKITTELFQLSHFIQAFHLLKMSLPAGVAALFGWGLMFIITICLTFTFSAEKNIAANQVLLILSGLLLVFIKVSSSIMVSQLCKRTEQSLGNKQFMIQHLIGYPLFYAILLVVLLSNFEIIVQLITREAGVILLLESIKYALACYVLLNCFDNILNNYLVSKQKNSFILKAQIISLIVFLGYLIIDYVLFGWTLNSLWVGLLVERSVLLILKIIRLNKDQPLSWFFKLI